MVPRLHWRDTMRTAVLGGLLVSALLAACAQGAPPGFSPAKQWSFPLVDPMADGRLVVPVYVEGRGPYLFAIDPDAPVTVADREVVGTEFSQHGNYRVVDEQDTSHPRFFQDIRWLTVGDLQISLMTVEITDKSGMFDGAGRRIMGILGKDVIADSLVFGFDRDRGVAWLSTQENYRAPANATVMSYFKGTTHRPELVVRKLVSANVDGKSYDLHLDLGAVPSQLWARHWKEAGLTVENAKRTLIDETGTHRDTDQTGQAQRVIADGVERDGIRFAPYDDRRWDPGQLEGTLGLGFFLPFNVAADWHHDRLLLTPRADHTPERLTRWGASLAASCEHAGCVQATVVAAREKAVEPPPATDDRSLNGQAPSEVRPLEAAAAAHPELVVTRDPAAVKLAMQVVLDVGGQRVDVSFPAGEATYRTQLAATGAVSVIDVSPFPKACPRGGVCGFVETPVAP